MLGLLFLAVHITQWVIFWFVAGWLVKKLKQPSKSKRIGIFLGLCSYPFVWYLVELSAYEYQCQKAISMSYFPNPKLEPPRMIYPLKSGVRHGVDFTIGFNIIGSARNEEKLKNILSENAYSLDMLDSNSQHLDVVDVFNNLRYGYFMSYPDIGFLNASFNEWYIYDLKKSKKIASIYSLTYMKKNYSLEAFLFPFGFNYCDKRLKERYGFYSRIDNLLNNTFNKD